jgi:hypothetical protein
MSYPREIRDIDSTELMAELNRRSAAVANGNCDYCGHPQGAPLSFPDGTVTTETCPKPGRHAGAPDERIYSVAYTLPGYVGFESPEALSDLVLTALDSDFGIDWTTPESYADYGDQFIIVIKSRASDDGGETFSPWIALSVFNGGEYQSGEPPIASIGDAVNDTEYTVEVRAELYSINIDANYEDNPALSVSDTVSDTVTPTDAG